MPAVVVILVCTLLFFSFFFFRRTVLATLGYFLVSGYLGMSYFHYFHGGWETAGNSNPFNEELIYSFLILSFVAVNFGFVAFLLARNKTTTKVPSVVRLKSFSTAFLCMAVFNLVLVFVVPLSFEMPVDLRKCDGAVTQPNYCSQM